MSSSPITILVVESDLRRANQIVETLTTTELFDCRCLRATSLLEASKQLSLRSAEVVVTAGSLPDAEHAEAVEALRGQGEGPLVVALLEEEAKEQALMGASQGADEYLFYKDLHEGRLEEAIQLSLERRNLLAELRDLQNKASGGRGTYRALLHRLDVAVFLVSRPEGELLFTNQVAEAWFGENREATLGELFEYGSLGVETLEIEVETGHSIVPNAELRSVQLEWRGRPCCLLTLRNISKRKRAEEAYKASQRRLELALKASNVGLWSWDLRHNQLQFSERWKAQLGYTGHEFSNSLAAFKTALHEADRERVDDVFRKALRGELSEIELEYRMLHRDGSARWILCRAEVFPDETGRLATLLGTHIDITDRRSPATASVGKTSRPRLRGVMAGRLQEALGKLEERARLIRASFRGDSEIVALAQELERLSRSVGCLNELTLATGEGNDGEMELGAEVSELYCRLESLLPAKVELQVESRKPIAARGLVRAELHQALAEALLSVSGRALADFRNRIIVRVAEELREETGEPHPVVEFVYLGKALEESNLRALAKATGMRAFASVEDGLSVLKLVLARPCERADAPTENGSVSDERPLALLAEDEGVLRMAIQTMLESLGYEVVVAEDGRAAVRLFRERPSEWAVALVDLHMPKVDGVGVVKAIRAERCQLPLIKMSGDDDAWEDPSDGCSQVLCKPFGIVQLRRAIREIEESPAVSEA